MNNFMPVCMKNSIKINPFLENKPQCCKKFVINSTILITVIESVI